MDNCTVTVSFEVSPHPVTGVSSCIKPISVDCETAVRELINKLTPIKTEVEFWCVKWENQVISRKTELRFYFAPKRTNLVVYLVPQKTAMDLLV